MDREQKSFNFEVKEIDEETGIFEGYAATFSDKPDSYGDIIDPGAFKRTLKEGGKRIKVLWQHDVMEPIGKPSEMAEDDKGLHIKAKLSLGVQRAREVLSLMKDGVITEMSIGYDAVKAPLVDGIRHLKEIKLYDVSPVVFAANPEAVIIGVKQAELKPYPNEHACRLRDPDDFQEGSFKRTTRVSDGKKYSVIMGRLEGETTMTEQAYRYDKEVWTEGEADSHCKDHDGKFEPAEKQDKYNCECIECGYEVESEKHCSDIKCPECGGEMRRAERPGPGKEKSGRVLSATNTDKVRAALNALQALLEAAEREIDTEKSNQLSSKVSLEATELESVVNSLKSENEGFDTKQAEASIEAILEQIRK